MIRIKRLWGVALLVAVLSLAAMAPGYAGRAGIAAVTATASTEQLLVGIRAGDPLDRGTDPQHLPGVNQANQDVAATELANRGEPALSVDGQNYYKGVSVFIYNAYPYYKTGWSVEIANGGRLPARIEGIEMSWEDGSGLRDYVRLDEITLHRGGVSQRLNTWEDLQTALRQFSIPPGGRLTVDFQYYFEETGEGGRLLPENARGRMVQTIRFGQEEPGGPGEPGNSGGPENPGVPNHSLNPDEPDTLQLPVNPGEPSDPPPPPPGEMAQEQPGAAATRPPVIPPGPGLPYTGGNPLAYLGAGVVLATLGILLRCRP